MGSEERLGGRVSACAREGSDWIYQTLDVQRFKIRDEILFP